VRTIHPTIRPTLPLNYLAALYSLPPKNFFSPTHQPSLPKNFTTCFTQSLFPAVLDTNSVQTNCFSFFCPTHTYDPTDSRCFCNNPVKTDCSSFLYSDYSLTVLPSVLPSPENRSSAFRTIWCKPIAHPCRRRNRGNERKSTMSPGSLCLTLVGMRHATYKRRECGMW
jgi:hypothetical protein